MSAKYWCCAADFGHHEPSCRNYKACPKCDGEMKPTDMVRLDGGELFECIKCGHMAVDCFALTEPPATDWKAIRRTK